MNITARHPAVLPALLSVYGSRADSSPHLLRISPFKLFNPHTHRQRERSLFSPGCSNRASCTLAGLVVAPTLIHITNSSPTSTLVHQHMHMLRLYRVIDSTIGSYIIVLYIRTGIICQILMNMNGKNVTEAK
ncbi:hypothetical protein ABKN59_001010 [Abortiporus biennis]